MPEMLDEKDMAVTAVESLIRIETTIGSIYRTFAQRFPAHQDDWSGMAGEEDRHARWIGDLHEEAREGVVSFKKSRFDIAAIERFLEYVEEKLNLARDEEISLVQAVDIAVDLETSLLERRFYDVFEGDSAVLRRTFDNMRGQIDGHIMKLRKLIAVSKG